MFISIHNFLSNYSIKVDYDQIPDNSINSDVVQLDINLYLRDYDINDVLKGVNN